MNTFGINNYKVLASAQITITDNTDASNLAGNMSVAHGTKTQVHINGATHPYVPNWQEQNLVLRPFMIASNITNSDKTSNPDLFDPWLYPTLGAANYIKDIKWYIIDLAGNQKEIKVYGSGTDETGPDANNFSHTWTYTKEGSSNVLIKDARHLVVKNNFLGKDEACTIMVKFAFLDPFSGLTIPVSYTMDLSCLSTGGGATRSVMNPVDGTSFFNANPQYLRFVGEYYKDGVKTDLQAGINNGSLTATWSIRSANVQGGWTILDSVNQDNNEFNPVGGERCYEIHKITSFDSSGIPTSEKTTDANGGALLKVYPGLIAGSDVIKLTVKDKSLSGQNAACMEVIYDYSDPTRVYIDSSNGDKLTHTSDKTNLKAVVTYNGLLLPDGSKEYGESPYSDNDRIFDYYWYKVESDGNTMYNMYLSGSSLAFKNVEDLDYTSPTWPKSGPRKMPVDKSHLDKKATFVMDLVDRKLQARLLNRENLLSSLISEDNLNTAQLLNKKAGIPLSNLRAAYTTAYEVKAYDQGYQNIMIDKFFNN